MKKGMNDSMSMKRFAMTVVCAGALIFTAACGGGGGAGGGNTGGAGGNTGGADNGTNVVADRPDVYNASCLSCHGTDLEGRVGGNSNLQNVGSKLSRDEILNTITNGRSGTSMPAFGNQLSEDQINELADWLASLK